MLHGWDIRNTETSEWLVFTVLGKEELCFSKKKLKFFLLLETKKNPSVSWYGHFKWFIKGQDVEQEKKKNVKRKPLTAETHHWFWANEKCYLLCNIRLAAISELHKGLGFSVIWRKSPYHREQKERNSASWWSREGGSIYSKNQLWWFHLASTRPLWFI